MAILAGLPEARFGAGLTRKIANVLLGRSSELGRIDRLVDDARASRGAALVLQGEPGIGKSALLDHAAERAGQGMRVLRVTGVEGEAEMPYSALHLLLSPVIDRIDALPDPQARALRGAFGMEPAVDGDRFLVGFATLTLLSELATELPLLCLVDDGQWIDTLSAEAVRFAARRIECDPIGLLAATRGSHRSSRCPLYPTDLPALRLGGLPSPAATALLARESPELPARLRDRVLAVADGNPLALLELPKTVGEGDAAGTGPLPITDRLQHAFKGQIDRLPEPTRLLLLVVAARGGGDLGTVMRAADGLGVPVAALAEAEEAGLVVVTHGSIRFRHPLMRTAVYHGALFTQRQAVHRTLAEVLEGGDPERAAWHLAAGTFAPDERVAAALERTAESAAQRHGQAAAAAAYERAAEFSEENAPRARRLVAAAVAMMEVGRFGRAEELRVAAGRLTDEPVVLARLVGLQGRLEFDRGSPQDAARITIDGALRIAAEEPAEAAALLVAAGYYAAHGADLPRVGEVVALLDTLDVPADHSVQQHMQQSRLLHQIVTGGPVDRSLFTSHPSSVWERTRTARMLNVIGHAAAALEVSSDLVAVVRADGMVWHLANALFHQACAKTLLGRHQAATETAEAALPVAEETGQELLAAYLRGLLAWLAALAGDDERCRTFADASIRYAEDHGMPASAADATWALALLELGHGRHERALGRMENHWSGWPCTSVWIRNTADHIEAAVRSDRPDIAERLLRELERHAGRLLDPCAPALVARCRALAGPADQAERNFAAALRPGPCDDRPFERARTLLAYGQWLRRERRKADARVRLRAALEIFQRSGAAPWAACAQRELRAAGDRSGAPAPEPGSVARLTPQELQVVRLAATGATNRDIGAQLFLSPRTVAQHLYRAFPKLGVATRTELAALDLDV